MLHSTTGSPTTREVRVEDGRRVLFVARHLMGHRQAVIALAASRRADIAPLAFLADDQADEHVLGMTVAKNGRRIPTAFFEHLLHSLNNWGLMKMVDGRGPAQGDCYPFT
jgi:hypothetical protein